MFTRSELRKFLVNPDPCKGEPRKLIQFRLHEEEALLVYAVSKAFSTSISKLLRFALTCMLEEGLPAPPKSRKKTTLLQYQIQVTVPQSTHAKLQEMLKAFDLKGVPKRVYRDHFFKKVALLTRSIGYRTSRLTHERVLRMLNNVEFKPKGLVIYSKKKPKKCQDPKKSKTRLYTGKADWFYFDK